MSLPRYPEYTDSGVAWLGKVPAHWAAHPLKHAIAKIESGVSVNAVDEPAESGGIGVLKTSCVYTGAFNPKENKAVVAEELSRVACPVRAGTLIVSRMNTPALVGAAGFVTESRDDLFLPDRLWQVHFREVANPAFVHYWTASPIYRAQVEMTCAGTSASMQNLSQDAFLAFTFPLPLPGEQVAIATFLDRETGKIDALIAEQEKLLTLLAEKRRATISHAVTKGLNPDAPMKDSGVAWLGEVPEHWKLKPMRYVSDLNPAISFDGCSEFDELTFLPMEQIKGGYYLPNTAPLAKCNSSYSSFDRGDILLAKVTPCFENGNIAISDEKGFGTSEIFVLRPQGIEPRLLFWYLQSAYFKMDGEASMTGAGGLKRVTTEVVRRHIVPVPPVNEQFAIATFLDRETSRLDTLKAESERTIALLKERRSALIAAAVTGQIDVRGLVTEPEAA